MNDMALNPEQRMLADSARRFVERGYDGTRREASLAHPLGSLPEVWRQFAELGWLALPIPEDQGGLGGSCLDICLVAQELGRGAVNEPFIACAVLAGGLLAQSADAASRDRWLGAIIEGRVRAAFARNGRFEALRSGDGHCIDGSCELMPGGAGADAFLVPAHTENGEVALFILAADTSGMSLQPRQLYDGQRATALQLQAAGPAHAAWQGSRSEWQRHSGRWLDRAVLAHCAETIGTMRAASEITLDYLQARKQFGRSIASNQVVQHRLVDLQVEIAETRALVFEAARAIDEGSGDAVQAARWVAAAKACAAGAAQRVWKEAVQLHGAIGMTQEYAVGQLVKRLAAASTLYGSEGAHLERLAELTFGALPAAAADKEIA